MGWKGDNAGYEYAPQDPLAFLQVCHTLANCFNDTSNVRTYDVREGLIKQVDCPANVSLIHGL